MGRLLDSRRWWLAWINDGNLGVLRSRTCLPASSPRGYGARRCSRSQRCWRGSDAPGALAALPRPAIAASAAVLAPRRWPHHRIASHPDGVPGSERCADGGRGRGPAANAGLHGEMSWPEVPSPVDLGGRCFPCNASPFRTIIFFVALSLRKNSKVTKVMDFIH